MLFLHIYVIANYFLFSEITAESGVINGGDIGFDQESFTTNEVETVPTDSGKVIDFVEIK